MSYTIAHGDCRAVMAEMPENSVDAVVTDPPYGLSFMGRDWDHGSPGVVFWEAAYRVLKPGGHLVAFGGTRTFHRLTCAIEDAGFEIRDCLSYLYGSGFPKSLDVSKAIDKHGGANIGWFGPWLKQERERRGIAQKELAVHFPSKTGGLTGCVANWELGFNLPTPEQFNTLCNVLDLGFERIEEAEREVIGSRTGAQAESTGRYGAWGNNNGQGVSEFDLTAPATDAAREWAGWGTALKPGYEIIIRAQKPYSEQSRIGSCLYRLYASLAARHSGSNPSGFEDGTSDSAQWNAAELRNTQGDSSGQTDTSLFESTAVTISLSIVSSWLNTWVAISKLSSTSTTSIGTSPITDWQTLWSCVSRLTPTNMLQAATNGPGSTPLADGVDALFAVAASNLRAIQLRSVLESVIEQEPTSPLAEDGPLPLSPAWEPIILARKPLGKPNVASNVLEYGTGAINVDGCRIESEPVQINKLEQWSGFGQIQRPEYTATTSNIGRWPANVVLDEEAATLLDEQSGEMRNGGQNYDSSTDHLFLGLRTSAPTRFAGDIGGASRFFYTAKASTSERNERVRQNGHTNNHPTVKPVDLMRWLCRLVCPPGGTILDPFLGSGTTIVAAMQEGFSAIGIEQNEEYVKIARARIDGAQLGMTL